jgi:polyferredoxin
MWLLIGAVAAGLLVSRAWCRYLCPLGAVLGICNRFSLFGIRREREDQPHCDMLPRECIMHTKPWTGDCVVCGECAEGCPRANLKLQPRYGRDRSPEPEVPAKQEEAS